MNVFYVLFAIFLGKRLELLIIYSNFTEINSSFYDANAAYLQNIFVSLQIHLTIYSINALHYSIENVERTNACLKQLTEILYRLPPKTKVCTTKRIYYRCNHSMILFGLFFHSSFSFKYPFFFVLY